MRNLTRKRITGILRDHIEVPRFDPGRPGPRDDGWPRISIITPSFNQARYLERTIVSIHNQGYPNLEHIIIDGGSMDESVRIIERYENVLQYWHSQPDKGQCDAINLGASHVTGRYMTWINSDDLLLPGALHRVASLIRQFPETDIIYGNQVEIDREDRVTKRVFTIDFDIRDFLYEINIIINQQSAFWKTDLFRRIGGLNDCPYAMDYDMFYRMYRTGMKYHRTPDFLSAFRIYPDSLTGSGRVGSSRKDTVDGIFRDAFERERNLMDRTVFRYWYKAGRFAREPRAMLAAVEHRLFQTLHRIRRPLKY